MTDSKPEVFLRTLRFKVKKEAYPWLDAAATEVNQVWNWCREVSTDAADRCRRSQPRFLSGYDLDKLSAGACVLRAHRFRHDSACEPRVRIEAPGGEASAAAVAEEPNPTKISRVGAAEGGKPQA